MKTATAKSALAASKKIEEGKEIIETLCRELVKNAEPLTTGRYEELCNSFRKLYEKGRYPNPHEEFFRRTMTQDEGSVRPQNFEECLRFVNSFNITCKKLARALENAETGKSDDGHSDLIDALTIAPQKIVEKICANPEKFKRIQASYKKTIGWIFDEEMFNHLHFYEALETYLPHAARNQLGQE